MEERENYMNEKRVGNKKKKKRNDDVRRIRG